jgi:hypothetical protein
VPNIFYPLPDIAFHVVDTNEALPQTDEGCGACGWFVSFLVGLRQGLVKLEIFLEATLA